jgi:2-polyprenyl-3-methyl-5-hydroxy-6-metoxy-1,4-benzoquinol methylase
MFDGFAPNFTIRSNETEIMDGSDYDPAELIESLGDLRRINRWLGGKRALAKHLFRMIKASGRQQIRLLDVGTGSADIPEMIVDWARARGVRVEFVVLDLNEVAARAARQHTADYPEIKVVCADALNLPFEDRSFDFVLASLFLHHFESTSAAALLKSFARASRVAFIINDLRRHPLAYYSIKVLTRPFAGGRLVRNDAAVSVLRGFTDTDINEIECAADLQLRTFRHFPYRYILIGQNNDY